MMPALADDNTASMKRRRLSIRSLALTSSSRWGAQLLRHLVEGLAELRQIALRAMHRHLNMQISGRNGVGGVHQPPDRRHQPVGEIQPISIEAIRMVSAITENISANDT